MATVRVGFHAPEKITVRHYLAGPPHDDLAFVSVTEPNGIDITFSGTVDELTNLLARMAEHVDEADRAIAAAKSVPLPGNWYDVWNVKA